MRKLPKPKKCKNCKESFIPLQPLQGICGYECALALQKAKQKEKVSQENKKKKKACKGNFRSNYFEGCGEFRYIEKYGLCLSCLREWAHSTGEGQEYIRKNLIPQAKKDVQKKQRKETAQKKVDLLSADAYRAKYVQSIFNEIARLIDHEQPCIATGNYGKMAGGHYHSVGSNRTTALHLHNIHIQSFQSNGPKGGDNIKYREGLKTIYGQDYMDYVESLVQIPPIKLLKDDLIVLKGKASKIRNRLKKNPVRLPPKARIRMRESINQELGIYEPININQL